MSDNNSVSDRDLKGYSEMVRKYLDGAHNDETFVKKLAHELVFRAFLKRSDGK